MPAADDVRAKNYQEGAVASLVAERSDGLQRHCQMAARANLPGVRGEIAALVVNKGPGSQ